MKKITKIDAVKEEKDKLRVAAYARVSTGNDDQLESLEAQKAHYEKWISEQSNWIYVGLYFDEGISGTKRAGRDGLASMLRDCEGGKIDFILTKSISRLARNTIDSLEMVRRLIDLDIGIYFEKENIDTRSMESELMLSILSSLAESESKSISENNKWSIKKRFQNGTYIISYPPYGYENHDGEMVIHEDQAKIVREIFSLYLSGKGTYTIAKILNERKIPSKRGAKWHGTTINGILKNEKYMGDVIYQKTYTDSQFKRHRNNGDEDQYLKRDNHPAIISREEYEKVQDLIKKRAREKGNGKDTERYQNRYALSGIIKCSECGGTFKRRYHYKPSGKYIAWTCKEHLKDTRKCSMKYVKDKDIKWCFVSMLNKLIYSHDFILVPLLRSLRNIKDKDTREDLAVLDEEIEKLHDRKETLITLMTNGILEPPIYAKERSEIIQEEKRLTEKKNYLENSLLGNKESILELEKLMTYTKTGDMHQIFQEEVFREIVEEVIVVDRKTFEFKLKCGLSLREEMRTWQEK